jgi:hypothetical protein
VGQHEGFVKIVTDKNPAKSSGCIIGPTATELIAESVVSNGDGMHGRDWPTSSTHPTLSEAMLDAANAVSAADQHLASLFQIKREARGHPSAPLFVLMQTRFGRPL